MRYEFMLDHETLEPVNIFITNTNTKKIDTVYGWCELIQ
jgi:hypothetical protein